MWPSDHQKSVEYVLVAAGTVCGDYLIAIRGGGVRVIPGPEYYGSFSGGSSECLRPVLARGCGGWGREGRELFREDRIGSNRATVGRLETLPPV